MRRVSLRVQEEPVLVAVLDAFASICKAKPRTFTLLLAGRLCAARPAAALIRAKFSPNRRRRRRRRRRRAGAQVRSNHRASRGRASRRHARALGPRAPGVSIMLRAAAAAAAAMSYFAQHLQTQFSLCGPPHTVGHPFSRRLSAATPLPTPVAAADRDSARSGGGGAADGGAARRVREPRHARFQPTGTHARTLPPPPSPLPPSLPLSVCLSVCLSI